MKKNLDIIISGKQGEGKSTAAEWIIQGSKKTIYVVSRMDDSVKSGTFDILRNNEVEYVLFESSAINDPIALDMAAKLIKEYRAQAGSVIAIYILQNDSSIDPFRLIDDLSDWRSTFRRKIVKWISIKNKYFFTSWMKTKIRNGY
jgi:hypothetical protein